MNFKITVCLIVAVGLANVSLGQTDTNAADNDKKIGFGLSPIVTISSKPNIFDGREKWYQLGAVLTGTIDFNDKNTWTYGGGFANSTQTSDFGFGFNKYVTNTLVLQAGYFRKFFFIDDIGLNFALGASAIYQIGAEKYQGNLLAKSRINFQSLTAAPAFRIEWAVTKYLSIHTSLGIGVSLSTKEFTDIFDYSNVTLRPLQRNDLLGQTGFSVFF